jgi:hypothetical protein
VASTAEEQTGGPIRSASAVATAQARSWPLLPRDCLCLSHWRFDSVAGIDTSYAPRLRSSHSCWPPGLFRAISQTPRLTVPAILESTQSSLNFQPSPPQINLKSTDLFVLSLHDSQPFSNVSLLEAVRTCVCITSAPLPAEHYQVLDLSPLSIRRPTKIRTPVPLISASCGKRFL